MTSGPITPLHIEYSAESLAKVPNYTTALQSNPRALINDDLSSLCPEQTVRHLPAVHHLTLLAATQLCLQYNSLWSVLSGAASYGRSKPVMHSIHVNRQCVTRLQPFGMYSTQCHLLATHIKYTAHAQYCSTPVCKTLLSTIDTFAACLSKSHTLQ